VRAYVCAGLWHLYGPSDKKYKLNEEVTGASLLNCAD